MMARVTSRGETALQVAADVGRAEFIEKLVVLMPPALPTITPLSREACVLPRLGWPKMAD